MKNILFTSLVFLLALQVSCVRRNSKDYIYKLYNQVKKEKIEDLFGWKIYRRGSGIIIKMYYDHLDSSKYEYYDSGKAVPFTRYSSIGFYITQDFDSLYHLKYESTVDFKRGVSMLSEYSNKNVIELEREIQSIFKMYKKYNISKMAGYPWSNTFFFYVTGETRLMKVGYVKNIENLKNDGYIQIEGDWWYKIEVDK